jgi:hypothetical protein
MPSNLARLCQLRALCSPADGMLAGASREHSKSSSIRGPLPLINGFPNRFTLSTMSERFRDPYPARGEAWNIGERVISNGHTRIGIVFHRPSYSCILGCNEDQVASVVANRS